MKAESSWAWSGEWVRVVRYESQSIYEGGWAWDTAGSKKGWGSFYGGQRSVWKRVGLANEIRTTCLGQRSDGLGIRMTLEFRGQRDKTVLYIEKIIQAG